MLSRSAFTLSHRVADDESMLDSNISETASGLEVQEWSAPEGWLIGAATRLVDCWSPQIEWVRMPALRWRSSRVELKIGRGRLSAWPAEDTRQRRRQSRRSVKLDDDTIAVDLRRLGGWNIAHAVKEGVQRFLAAEFVARQLDLGARLVAIVSEDVSPFVRETYELFGIAMIATNAEVTGRFVGGQIESHQAIALASDLMPARVSFLLDERISDFPRRIFLARRGSRAITNTPEIARFLEARGFSTVYPEELSVVDQFRLLWHADEVVGVHGAALALLLPRVLQRPRRPLHFIEVFGPGYIVSLYRCLAARIGANWVGVRGRVTPEVVRDLEILGESNWRYRLARALRGWVPTRWLPGDAAWQRTHQIANFEVDPRSLELALETVRDPDRALPERVW